MQTFYAQEGKQPFHIGKPDSVKRNLPLAKPIDSSSLETSKFFYYIEKDEKVNLDTSSLFNFHKYRKDNQYLWLGNNGLSSFSLVFNPNNEIGFNYSYLLKDVSNFSYKEYNVFAPFTSIKYVQGARLEQYFELTHTQNFSKRGNFSLTYKKINSDGSYLRQKTNNNDLAASVWYATKRYKASFFANRIKNTTQQNGGLVNDSSFTIISDFGSNRKTISVNLDSAEDLKIANQLALFQQLTLSNSLDSLGNGTSNKVHFNSKFTNSKRYYIDGEINSDFYQNIFIDSTETNDSIKLNQIEQEIAYEIIHKNSQHTITLRPKANYYYTDYRQASHHLFFNEFSVGFNGGYKSLKSSITTSLDFFINGYRQNNYQFNTYLDRQLSTNVEWFLSATLQKYNPSLDLVEYNGNHTVWNNDFVATEAMSFSTGTKKNKWNILASFTYTDIKNPIYFNYELQATQALDYTQILQADIAKEFNLKKWKITPQFVYQYTGGILMYRLPNYFGSLKLGYSFKAFKKTLGVFTGLKVTYYNNVQLMSYSPSIGQFYLADNNAIGNYPFVDFFINTQIKSVRLFFAMTHLNQGLTKQTNYFGAMHYPLEDRAYKVGLNWNFLK